MKTKHMVALGVAAIAAISGVAGASINAMWGKSDVVNVYIGEEKMALDNEAVQEMITENNDLIEQNNEYKKNMELLSSGYKALEEDSQDKEAEILRLEEENEGLKKQIENYEAQIEDLQLKNNDLKEENAEDLSEGYSGDGELIWDVLPPERLNAPDVRLPSDGNPFVMSGEKCYGVYIKPSWGGKNNIYLYLNNEISDVSFRIGHVDGTYERETEVKILLDESIYGEPCTINYSEQPREFKLSNLDDVGTLLISVDNYLDGTSVGPAYGITDIYLKKAEQ